MLKGMFGPQSITHMLRGGLEETSATHRTIAGRVADSMSASSSVDFSDALSAEAARQQREADLQRDMTELVDTQLRYEADARLLREAYSRLRIAVNHRA